MELFWIRSRRQTRCRAQVLSKASPFDCALSLECTSYSSKAHTPVCAGLCFVFLLKKVQYSCSIPVLTWFSAVIFCKQLSSDTGGPRLGSFQALGPKIPAEVSSHHVITPVSSNSHPLWLILVPVSENHNNTSLADNCLKFAQSSYFFREQNYPWLPLTWSPFPSSLWNFVCPTWTGNSTSTKIF